ncbi:hypothetical protein NBRC116589_13260 [Ruegeria sp. HU-ET01832]
MVLTQQVGAGHLVGLTTPERARGQGTGKVKGAGKVSETGATLEYMRPFYGTVTCQRTQTRQRADNPNRATLARCYRRHT